MIIDSQLQFSDAQAITDASAASTNIVDISIARNIGAGTPQLYLVVVCTETMVGAGATVTPSLRTSATASAAAPAGDLNGTINTIPTSATAFAALSAAGTAQVIPLPPNTGYLRYIDVYYTLAVGTLSAGKFSAFIVTDTDLQTFYAAGYTVG